MAQISIGAAVGAGFGLIARRPLAVLAWGVIPVLLQAATLALVAPLYISMLGNLAAGGGATPPTFGPQILQFEGALQLFNLLQLAMSAVIYCAVFRAVLFPERSSFAYMRVGAAELFLVVLIIGGFVAFFIGLLVVMIPVGILIGVVAAVTHGTGVALAALLPILMLVLMVGVLILSLRFVFVGPMMVEDGKFHLFESWTMTRGRVGSLFLLALCLLGVLLAAELVILIPFVGIAVAAIAALGGIQPAVALFQESPAAALARLWPFLAAYVVLLIPISGCATAILGAPWARAYKDLAPDASSVFA